MSHKSVTLTPEQIAELPEIAAKWVAIGLSTDPADRPRAEAAIRWLYDQAGKAEPRIIWCGSPLSQAITRAILMEYDETLVGGNLRKNLLTHTLGKAKDRVRTQVRDTFRPVWNRVAHDVGFCVLNSIAGSLRNNVCSSVSLDSLQDNVWGSVRLSASGIPSSLVEDRVRSIVWSSINGDAYLPPIGNSVDDSFFGSLDAMWLAAGDMYKRFGLDTTSLYGGDELVRSAGWILPHVNICWVSERPCTLRRDAEGRLHSETGAAVEYPDGWKIHAWHGTHIPAHWIENRSMLEIQTALTWSNIEQRRAAAEIIGWDRVLEQVHARILDTDPDPQIGVLLEAHLPDAPLSRFLRVLCSTGRQFCLPVPPTVRTALEANCWTYQWEGSPEDFRRYHVRT